MARLAAAHDGRMVKPEGDGGWVVCPSVTAGARAAMHMQEEWRLAQLTKGDDRRAMRIVLSLAARLEAVTPPDAISLSTAAWLAVQQAAGRTAVVDAFPCKGCPEPGPVYRIAQTHRTRGLTDQYIVCTDLRGCSTFTAAHAITVVEQGLAWLLALVGRAGLEFGGTHRCNAGEGYCLTLPDARLAMAAVERLAEAWGTCERCEGLHGPLQVGVHQGGLYACRSYLYGDGLDGAEGGARAPSRLPPGHPSICVPGQGRRGLVGTPWAERLQPLDVRSTNPRLAAIES